MKNRKWLKFYTEQDCLEVGIIPSSEEEMIILRMESIEPSLEMMEVKLDISEVEDLISFLQTLVKDLTEEE